MDNILFVSVNRGYLKIYCGKIFVILTYPLACEMHTCLRVYDFCATEYILLCLHYDWIGLFLLNAVNRKHKGFIHMNIL